MKPGMMKKFGIKAKIWASTAIFGAGYLALLALLQWTSYQTEQHMTTASASLFPAALSSQEASANFQKLVKRYNQAVLMMDEKALSSADQDAQLVARALQDTADKTSFSPLRYKQAIELGKRFADIRSRSQSLYSEMIRHPDSMSVETQHALSALAHGNKELDAALQELRSGVAKDFQSELAAVDKWSRRQRAFGILLLMSALGVGVLVANWLGQTIATTSQSVLARAEAIAAGDLTREDLVLRSRDELGDLTTAINEMSGSLRRVILAITDSATQVAMASQEISSRAAESADAARSQADQTGQLACAMQQMSSTVLNVSENSQKAASFSGNAAQAARQGGEIVQQTLATMRTIAESTEKVASRISELGKNSEQIGRIVGVIRDIAEQTNLLALNAAIEAARAGEQGRGFAVVADEVRRLADRTTQATKEVSTMIESIQHDTRAAVDTMQQGGREVQAGVEKTAKSGHALNEIIRMSEQVGDMIMQIATAANQQSSTTDEINSNVLHISESTKSLSAATQETAQVSIELSNLAADLRKLVGQFKLSSSAMSDSRETVRPRARAAAAR
jgi:methyl-accepting chemotaxis protein